jgi:DNA-binding Xre family transcriptional regulator
VPDPQAGFASGRVEDSRSFSQKNSRREFFCEKGKKCTMLPQAVCIASGETSGLHINHVTCVQAMAWHRICTLLQCEPVPRTDMLCHNRHWFYYLLLQS